MKVRHLVLVLLCWAAVAVTMSGQAGSAQEALEAARKTAVIDGDLAGAIKQYQAIVARYEKTDRAVAAQALLRMAECYEKQGSVEAQRIYARVIREYADQVSVVAEARVRVVRPSEDQSQASRLVWTLPGISTWVRGNVSPNGPLLTLAAPQGGGLMVHDVTAGTDRVIARPTLAEPDIFFGATAFSRDSRRLAYQVAYGPERRQPGLRIVNLEEPGVPESRLLLEAHVQPCDWSPDGKWIAVRVRKETRRVLPRRNPVSPWQLGLVSAEDGSLRVLKTIDALYRSYNSAAFSPDGRFVAFEVPENETGARDIVVWSVDGRSEVRAVQQPGDDLLVGWSPDGTGVLYSSARGAGSYALWLQPLESGALRDSARLVRAEGPAWPLGLTEDGALYFGVDNDGGVGVKQAIFDTTSGAFLSPLEDVPSAFVRSSRGPRWSPDGSVLGYISIREERGGDVFVTRDVESGEAREVPLDVRFRNNNRNLWFWGPDGTSVLTIAEDHDPVAGPIDGLFQTDLLTGRTELVVARELGNQNVRNPFDWSPDRRVLTYSYLAAPGQYVRVARDLATGEEREVPRQTARQSPDGRKTYVNRRRSDGVTIVERHTGSGEERELLDLSGIWDWYLTEKGQSIIALTTDLSTNESVVMHYSMASGARRDLFRSGRGQTISIGHFAPDERSLIAQFKTREGGTSLFWWVPTDGRPPRLLTELSGFEDVGWEFHPDGRRVALQVNYPRTSNDQIFVLENFLPPARR